MQNSYQRLAELLRAIPAYIVDGRLSKNLIAELARKYDTDLLNLLLSDGVISGLFFTQTTSGPVFKKDIFLEFISQKEFLPDSYTAFAQKIGLACQHQQLSDDQRIVLEWPYKDCLLEGGQEREEKRRAEVFFNEILAPDQITTLLEDKVFVDWKRHDATGEHDLDQLRAEDNLIIKGNNLLVLHSLKKRFAGKVKLIYIDPPYNTGNDSFKYNDRFNHSTWLTFMRNRLLAAKALLADDGFIFVQCDDNEQAYLRVLMDELFIDSKYDFDSTIVVKVSPPNGVKIVHADRKILKEKEFILVYKGRTARFNPQYIENADYDEHYNLYENPDGSVVPLRAKLRAEKLDFSIGSQQFLDWAYTHADHIFQPVAAPALIKNQPKYQAKRVQPVVEMPGYYAYDGHQVQYLAKSVKPTLTGGKIAKLACDLWTDISFNNLFQEGGVSLRAGKKPEKLLARIIALTTKPGDIVLDYHLGSGTTAAVAHKMGRQYIGIEQLWYDQNDATVRLQNVIDGEQTGVSRIMNWRGGGSFVACHIKNDANQFREKVLLVDDNNIKTLLDEVLKSSFLSYRINPKKFDQDEFNQLSFADQKRLLLELIDNNALYLNYSEMNDSAYHISEPDKKFNREFYGV